MATYLLLRNNRESGPLTKDQLIALGLKPYDLIWVEGRSAAWRYANEIPDLKDHAPAVEEQPYDRFYKKNAADPVKEYVETMVKKYAEEPVKKYVEQTVREREEKIIPGYVNTEQPVKKHIEVPAGEQKEEIAGDYVKTLKVENGSVSVIMPKQNSSSKNEEPVYKKITVVDEDETTTIKKYAASETKEDSVVRKVTVPKPLAPLAAIDDFSVNMETKYSTPLDEIKERYVRQLSDRKQANAQRKFIIKTLKHAAIFIVVIGAGVLIGFAIKPKQPNKSQVVDNSLQNVSPATNVQSVKEEAALTNDPVPEETLPSAIKENASEVQSEKKAEAQPTRQVDEKKSPENTSIEPSVIESSNGERNKNIRMTSDEVRPVEKKNVAGRDLSDQVFVKANDYKERDFGGFRNLQLTVKNDSKVTLETVIVELTYKKFNDDIVSIKNIPFRAIAPGDTLTIKVPDNNRGAKLSYRVIRIDPRDP